MLYIRDVTKKSEIEWKVFCAFEVLLFKFCAYDTKFGNDLLVE